MRSTILLLAALVAAPLVSAAGPSASVSTLTDSSSCRSAHNSTFDSGTYYGYPPVVVPVDPNGSTDPNGTNSTPTDPVPVGGWYDQQSSESRDCASRSDVADAQVADDSGTLASASVGGGNQSSQNGSYSSYGSWYDDGTYRSWSSGWADQGSSRSSDARGADVQVLGADAGESSGCASQSSYGAQEDGWSSGSFSSYDESRSSSYAQTCGDTIHATDAGHGASAGDASACQDSESSSGHGYEYDSGNASYTYQYAQATNSSACRSGLVAGADGNDLFAGNERSCQDGSQYRRSGSGNETGSSSYSARDCSNAYAVEGPQRTRLAAEDDSWSRTYCGNGCSSYSQDWSGVTWSWPGSPVEGLQSLSAGTPVPVLP